MDTLGYGVCRLSVVAVRQTPEAQAPLVTQLLFGDHYEVLAVPDSKQWIYIRMHFDGVEGWISSEQHHGITQEYFDQINHANFKITTDLTSNILYKKSPLTILMGSIVPISNSELFKMEEQFAFNGEAKSLGQKRDGEFVKAIASKLINAPELPGGRTPFGIDTAGFIQLVFKIAGYSLPRNLDLMREKSIEQPEVGDVIVFGNSGKMGIWLEENKYIHVQGRVRIDTWEPVVKKETRFLRIL